MDPLPQKQVVTRQDRLPDKADDDDDAHADPVWFRAPSRREHWMAAGLFVGFGVFFVLLFWVTAGFWFRWVTLGLGLFSILRGLRHVLGAVAGSGGG
jgi:hypothetical protein